MREATDELRVGRSFEPALREWGRNTVAPNIEHWQRPRAPQSEGAMPQSMIIGKRYPYRSIADPRVFPAEVA